MNIYIRELAREKLDTDGDAEVKIEDNIGESIHIHFRKTRLEMSIDDFRKFANHVEESREVLVDGNSEAEAR